jgi:hypothetical protein
MLTQTYVYSENSHFNLFNITFMKAVEITRPVTYYIYVYTWIMDPWLNFN